MFAIMRNDFKFVKVSNTNDNHGYGFISSARPKQIRKFIQSELDFHLQRLEFIWKDSVIPYTFQVVELKQPVNIQQRELISV